MKVGSQQHTRTNCILMAMLQQSRDNDDADGPAGAGGGGETTTTTTTASSCATRTSSVLPPMYTATVRKRPMQIGTLSDSAGPC